MIPGYRLGEPVHRGAARIVWRAVRESDGQPVIIKTLAAVFPNRTQVAALQREFQILQRLQGEAPVVRVHELVNHGHGNVALVMAPFGTSLALWLDQFPGRRVPLAQWLDLAIVLAQSLAPLHAGAIVHKNLSPDSVLIDGGGAGTVPSLRLIDFSLASELSRERQDDALGREFAAALPYMSPEQTGRMNRELDYRSDHYALGVLLYELLTGRWPLQADTVLGWVHAHIGKAPRPPQELDPSIPDTVAAIVAKLMAKNAEDRYQSAYGLIEDLQRCRRELKQQGRITAFALGHQDVSPRLHVPQKLYGREPELAALSALIEQVAQGTLELCTVEGSSGIGKSALVGEAARQLLPRNGYLLQGKFDQFQRGTPYAALAAALRDGVRQWLVEDAPHRARWRERLQQAVAPNGQVLVDLVPELGQLLGPQPPVPELPRTEAQNRFQIALVDFLRTIAAEQPVLIFLDDLQFGDTSTLQLLRWLAGARDLPHLLLIGAFRSNEVSVGHPLQLTLDEIAQARPNGRTLHRLQVGPLPVDAVQQLLADTLHVEPADCLPLALLLQERAQGNPFFLGELLATLERAGAIRFVSEVGRWRWDLDAVRRCDAGAGVVEFVLANLRELPPITPLMLQLAACIGNSFDLRTLAITAELPPSRTARELMPALQRHVIQPLDDGYRLAGQGDDEAGAINPRYRFQHDRVQQAAYALIDEQRRQAVHLSVGRLMKRHATAAELHERLIDIVGHLNQGRRLIDSEAERLELARLNLEAGLRAQRSSAYESALAYLRIGQELLPADAWQRGPELIDLAMALATEVQQCTYLTGRTDEAEHWLEQLLAHAKSDLQRADILSMRTRQYSTTGRMEASIRSAIQGLALLGIPISESPSAAVIARERAAVKRHLAGRRIAALIDAPALADPAQRIAIRLLMEIFPAAFLSGSGNLFPYLVLKSVNISLAHGHSAESAFAYAAYGMLLCGALDDPALGHEFGCLAVAMNDRLDDIALKSRVMYVHAMFIHHWSNHWSTLTPWFRRGIESGYQSGDLLYLAYNAQDCIIWDPRLDLERAEREHAEYLRIVRDTGYRDSFDSGSLFLQMQRCLLGRTRDALSLSDDGFDEQQVLAGMHARRFMTGVANFHIYKAEVACLHDAPEAALPHVLAQEQLLASSMSLPQLVRFVLVAFLVRAALLPGRAAAEAAGWRVQLQAGLRRMARWARHCPENFAHLHALMRAELARLDGHADAALRHYEQAQRLAERHGWRRDEAQAHELAAAHLLALGRGAAAEGHLRTAWRLYEHWGARRKLDLLRARHPDWFADPGGAPGAAPGAAGIGTERLDLDALMKSAQAIAGEVVAEQLWSTTLAIMLENAGGQRGCFVVRRHAHWTIEGLAGEAPAAPSTELVLDGPQAAALLPVSLVYQVLNTREPVVLHDARRSEHAARDAYLRSAQPQSLLCLPLLRQGQLEGALYMENRIAAGVFGPARVALVRALCAQVAVAIENARLYDEQARLIKAQRRFVPREFLESLNRPDIAMVDPGEHVGKTMSVMFSDLRGFTPLAERLPPRDVMGLLNGYFDAMGEPIAAAGGFIDSFAGDEIKALFDQLASDAAVHAGVGMWRALEAFNRRSAALGQPQLRMGVGLHTGPVVLGTVGSDQRLQCSVVGDSVNLASRIEQLTKPYGARFLISDDTRAALARPEAWALRCVDRVAVKGRDAPVALYEVLDAETPARRDARLATRELLERAGELYRAREFATALSLFEAACRADPDDAVPPLFVERCLRYRTQAPPADWRGVERLASK
ncbi:AAA family ATPase [Aquabacterium humicola]|uniref:AAA family ATPase n=1 Tax=Aquabacterium humicola TaxID=3237377 RepID=UPI0025434EDB|nr:AAA family ATPase [Rubrivivax pictus]